MAAGHSFKRLPPTSDHAPFDSPMSPIKILGSGLSALTLALSLCIKEIPFKIYTKDCRPQKPLSNRHNYSLLLKASTIKDLRILLSITRDDFRKFLMVPSTTPFPPDDLDNFEARVHRGRLEYLLRQDFEQEIEWNCEIKAGTMGSPPLVFPPHVKDIKGHLTFDCMGVHSPIICADRYRSTESIVVFRGTSEVSKSLWNQKFRGWFHGNEAQIQARFDNIVLQLIINNFSPDNGDVSLTCIYSRPCWGDMAESLDTLWLPTRSVDEASSPSLIAKFLNEIELFRLDHELPEPYDEIFNPENLKGNKIVHWLMRTKLTALPELINLWRSSDEKVIKLGDASYNMPIIGSTGAEFAIRDALDAAEEIEKDRGASFPRWFIDRQDMKESQVTACRRNLIEIHSEKNK
ncbi:hypothetical protein SBOR_1362 [Sclerotinia borealis F-4128]|uniref:FAD-binding domain-containing protein n=1 Tax=Sclerotinia borealis (strain F-4128) TaxID=1432307 RepID=W9CR00_SCLBF|nr:hypothetical protein SBOR_1362 [Sclerotinia borealis F-4128]